MIKPLSLASALKSKIILSIFLLVKFLLVDLLSKILGTVIKNRASSIFFFLIKTVNRLEDVFLLGSVTGSLIFSAFFWLVSSFWYLANDSTIYRKYHFIRVDSCG